MLANTKIVLPLPLFVASALLGAPTFLFACMYIQSNEEPGNLYIEWSLSVCHQNISLLSWVFYNLMHIEEAGHEYIVKLFIYYG